ncbi:MAG TPA: hypothetical protein VNN72_24860 [Polyangiaceae bacterium]|nr:hypothetical protein [Polyangiaceae bacterium]
MRTRILRNARLWFAGGSVWAAACGGSGSGSHGGSSGHARGGSAAAGAPAAGSAGTAGVGASGGSGTAGKAGGSTGGTAGKGDADPGGRGESGDAGDRGTAAAAGDGAPGGAGSNESGGTGGTNGQAGELGVGGEGATGGVAHTDKIDLLIVVDNSISMFEKQKLLAAAVPKLVLRLVDPWCVGGGEPAAPAEPGHVCPVGRELETTPVNDMHLGVITSSLGAHGSHDVCSEEQNALNVTQVGHASDYDDKGQLLPLARPSPTLPSWDGSGFLNWDPLHRSAPTGQGDPQGFIDDFVEQMSKVGAHGCGYESTLEAMYRFLVDPEPPRVIDSDKTTSLTTVSTDDSNTDHDLLEQRAAFLRPDSALVIISLSDEDDCSIDDTDGKQGWLTGYKGGVSPSAVRWPMPRARAICATDPNNACCAPCPGVSASCDDDPVCATRSLTTNEDSLNMRCFAQKRRFGIDLLYSLERYTRGLSQSSVPRRSGGNAPNPLFADGRDRRLVLYVPIVGVPWQDLAKEPLGSGPLDLMSAAELRADNRWPALVGDFDAGEPPEDPFMVASIDPRTALVPNENPFTNDPIVAEDGTDPLATINGHEHIALAIRDDLQYACTFPLSTPVDCSGDPDECDCSSGSDAYNTPLCQKPGGTGAAESTQYFGKAYPGIRHLEVARRLGDQAQVASICPRDTATSASDDYGYLPAMRVLQTRISALLGSN